MSNTTEHTRRDEDYVSSLHELYQVINRLYRQEGWGEDAREDIVQETVVETWMSWGKRLGRSDLLPPTSISPPIPVGFARRVLQYTYLDYLRKRKSKHLTESLEAVKQLPSFTQPEPRFVLADLARSVLSRLTKRERTLLKLRYARGKSFEYIAQVLKTTPDAARSMVSRAVHSARLHTKDGGD